MDVRLEATIKELKVKEEQLRTLENECFQVGHGDTGEVASSSPSIRPTVLCRCCLHEHKSRKLLVVVCVEVIVFCYRVIFLNWTSCVAVIMNLGVIFRNCCALLKAKSST